ncbi:MAG TPA: peptidylprolyl isomerase [Segetibacter sp.]
MSVIQKIRDKYAALVISLIALSLIAFILMDAFVGRGSGAGSTGTTIGKVNGHKIQREEFEKKISMQQAMYGEQAPPREQLISNVWDMSIEEIVMQEEYDKLGLQFGSKELSDVLFGANPPQWLKGEFTDPQTGVYNANAARQYFAQIKKKKNDPNTEMFNEAYIKPTISQGLRTKYAALLAQSTYVPKWMAEKTLADQSAMASFTYVSVPYTSISDSAVKVTDDDVRAYMNKHKKEFEQEEETRSISYVTFDAFPNRQDTLNAYNQVMTLKNEFASAPDVKGYLARVSSEIPYLDAYTPGSKIQVPFADSIKKLADGQIFGPYVDGPNYSLARMVGRRSLPDSVKVRHILLKTGERGQVSLPDSIAKRRIDSIEAAIRGGADFRMMVQQYSDDAGSKNTGGEYEFSSIQFSNLTREFAEVAFYGATGDKKVVKVDNPAGYSGYHYIEVMNQRNPETAYKIAYLAKPISASQETINSASSAASQFAGNSRNKKAFDENVTKAGKQTLAATDLKQSDYTLAGLGDSRQLVRWVYENEAGDVSEPFEVNDRYVVAVINSVDKKGQMSVAKARILAEPFIRNEKKAQMIISTKFKAGGSLDAIAQAAGVGIMRADSVSFAQPFIPNIGNEPKIAGAAFNKALQGKVSEPIAGNTGVFVIRGENISAVPSMGNAEDQRRQMEMQQKQMGGFRAMQALRKAADVDDNRFEFY